MGRRPGGETQNVQTMNAMGRHPQINTVGTANHMAGKYIQTTSFTCNETHRINELLDHLQNFTLHAMRRTALM